MIAGPLRASAGALNRVTISKFPLNTESGVGEKSYFSDCGFGYTTCSACSGSFAQVNFSGIR